MVKWTIVFAIVALGIVGGVIWFVGFAGGIGKDTVKLKNGTVMEVPITRYREGNFYYKKPNLNQEKIPLKNIVRITFTTIQDDKFDKHELTTVDGKKRRCRIVSYYRGELKLKDPKGNVHTGKISEILQIDFKR